MTIGKGKPGRKGFQPERVLDIAKLDEIPGDFPAIPERYVLPEDEEVTA